MVSVIKAKPRPKKKRQAQDSTLINIRAAKKRIAALEKRVRALEGR